MPFLLLGLLVGLSASGSTPGALPDAHAPRPVVRSAAQAPPAAQAPSPGAAPAGAAAAPIDPNAAEAETERIFAKARLDFDAGNDHYAAGRYEEAIKSFQAGYALVPRPNFLVNIGQSYRKLGNLVRAKEAYLAYVRALPENSALRDQALQVLAEIEVQLQDRKDGSERTAPLPEAAPARSDLAQNPLAPVADTGTTRTAAWFGIGIGATGLALVATGVGFQLRAKSASDSLTEASRHETIFEPDEERAGKRAEKIGNGLFAAGAAVMAAGLLLFLVVDSASAQASADAPARIALTPDGLGLGWRF